MEGTNFAMIILANMIIGVLVFLKYRKYIISSPRFAILAGLLVGVVYATQAYLEKMYWGRPETTFHLGFDGILLVISFITCRLSIKFEKEDWWKSIFFAIGMSVTGVFLVQMLYHSF